MIKKLEDKFFILTAFISAACLTVYYMPTALIKGTYSFWSDNVALSLFPLMTLVSTILLLLDLFSLKFEIIQRKVWMVFAAIGVVPILPFSSFWPIMFVFSIYGYIIKFCGFIVGLF